jgi:hypothetical protein
LLSFAGYEACIINEMHPREYTDTTPKAMAFWLALMRQTPPDRKIYNALSAGQFVLDMYEAGVRSQYPHADEREVRCRVAARHLPRDLMIKAYHWDPDEHP